MKRHAHMRFVRMLEKPAKPTDIATYFYAGRLVFRFCRGLRAVRIV